MSLLTNKRIVIAKLETIYGTDPVPTGSNAILCRSVDFTPLEGEAVTRELIRPYLGIGDSIIAQRSARVQMEIELAGSGAAGTAPKWGPLLKACGFEETIVASTSVSYAPLSASFPSITIYVNVDGVLHKVTGARGSVSFGMSVKGIPVMKFNFLGIYNAPTDTAAVVADFTGFQIPKIVNTSNTTAFSLFGYSGRLQSMDLDMACDVQYRTLVNFEEVTLVGRKPSGQFVLEAPTIAAKDFFAAASAGDTGAMSITHGIDAGNIVQLDAPKVSIVNPNYGDSQGVQMLTVPFNAAPDAGNDEVTVTCT